MYSGAGFNMIFRENAIYKSEGVKRRGVERVWYMTAEPTRTNVERHRRPASIHSQLSRSVPNLLDDHYPFHHDSYMPDKNTDR